MQLTTLSQFLVNNSSYIPQQKQQYTIHVLYVHIHVHKPTISSTITSLSTKSERNFSIYLYNYVPQSIFMAHEAKTRLWWGLAYLTAHCNIQSVAKLKSSDHPQKLFVIYDCVKTILPGKNTSVWPLHVQPL